MISYWTCKVNVNGIIREIEIVGENPTFEKYKNRIERDLGIKPKDKVEFIGFTLKVEKLGLIRQNDIL